MTQPGFRDALAAADTAEEIHQLIVQADQDMER